jgi:hypothetical protein
MKHCTTSGHLTRTIHQLEHILADEDLPAIRAASLVADTLCEIALELPEEDQHQIARIVALYAQCAYKQYGPVRETSDQEGIQRIRCPTTTNKKSPALTSCGLTAFRRK